MIWEKASLGLEQDSLVLYSILFLFILSDHSSYSVTFLTMFNWMFDQIFLEDFSEDKNVLLIVEYL